MSFEPEIALPSRKISDGTHALELELELELDDAINVNVDIFPPWRWLFSDLSKPIQRVAEIVNISFEADGGFLTAM